MKLLSMWRGGAIDHVLKAIITIVLCGLCMSTMAANRFIVKYKLTESQEAFLSSGADIEGVSDKVREELMGKLSQEQLDILSEKANVQIKYSYPLYVGYHAIILSENLDKVQTEQFIHNVEQHDDVDSIEESKRVKAQSQW